jgi:hypothetical protein
VHDQLRERLLGDLEAHLAITRDHGGDPGGAREGTLEQRLEIDGRGSPDASHHP